MKVEDPALRGRLRILQVAAFLSAFDRFTTAPMLVTIAAGLDVSLDEVAVAASVYFLLYGLMQPVWGVLSDRLGRVLVMRIALIGVLVPGIISAFAPNLLILVVGRALAGGLFAAIVPASLVYIGDTVPMESRQRALSDQLGTSAIATSLATAAAGVAAYFELWRVAFAAPVLVAFVVGFWISRVPEPERSGAESGVLSKVSALVRSPWAVLVVTLALIEGGAILGFLTFLAPALEEIGYDPAVAGMAVALFGIATLAWTRAVEPLRRRIGKSGLILTGGALMTLGYASGAVGGLAWISLAAFLVGGGFALMHPTLQNWATEVAPEARATVISSFAAALFVGSALATMAAAPLAEEGSFGLLFAVAAATGIPLGILGGLARHRYPG